jgi:elongation factor G
MGELHLEIILDRARREHNLEMLVSPPQVAYRETITRPARGVGKYIKQSGGRGQYGHVVLEISPLEEADFSFENCITGGAIPKEYIPAIERGTKETLEKGILLGYPVVNVAIRLMDGSFHEVDSSDLAFKIASSLAVKEAFFKANPILLEPVMKVDIAIPEEHLGSVVAHVTGRRGRITSLTERNGSMYIVAHIPLEGMFGYMTELRSLTKGRGHFTMEFSHYAPTPRDVFERIRGKPLSEESYG